MALLALAWGLVAGGAGLVGALVAIYARPRHWLIALGVAFGSGILLSIAAFELFDDSFHYAGFRPAAFGFLLGTGVFALGLYWLDRQGAGHRKRSAVKALEDRDTATTVAMATIFDGIPKALIIGITFYHGEGVGLAVVFCMFLANIFESLASTTRMVALRRGGAYIALVWVSVAVATGVAALIGYELLGDIGPRARAFVQAFAGGAFFISIVDGMIPSAFYETRNLSGFVTAMGFLLGYGLSHFLV